MDIIRPKYLKWNSENSTEHFNLTTDGEGWENGSETYFHVYHDAVFDFTSYSNVKKSYSLDYSGISLKNNEQKVEISEPIGDPDFDEFLENHQIEVQWLITEPTGYVVLNIDGSDAVIEWNDHKITDFFGKEARLVKVPNQDFYKVEEILTLEETERLVEIKRLARVRDMVKGKVREMLNHRITGLFREGL